MVNDQLMIYAGFWRRFGAFWLDAVFLLPLTAIVIWLDSKYRLFLAYYFFPGLIFGLFYSVYLVRKFGGTPGKLILGIKISKLDGSPVTYREAILRYLPYFVLSVMTSIALIFAVFQISDSEYLSLSFINRTNRLVELTPSWYKPTQLIQNIWTWSEFFVLLTNRKRRAIHDFIAGTVVIKKNAEQQPTAVVAAQV